MRYNIFWLLAYKLFKIRRPMPKGMMDFDRIDTISETAKKELDRE